MIHIAIAIAVSGVTRRQIGDSVRHERVGSTICRMTSRALKAMLLLARAENAALASENLRFKTQNERFAHILRVLRRAHFGRSSEQIER